MLRHAVTHEDLPALEVLRSGAEQALEWLRVRVVGPAVFDSLPAEEKEQWDGEEAFRAALGKYKRLMKQYYRQRTSKASTTGGWEGARELRMTLREVEDLVGAAVEGKDDDAREKVGRRVVQVLLGEEGGMIPSLRLVRSLLSRSMTLIYAIGNERNTTRRTQTPFRHQRPQSSVSGPRSYNS